MEAAYVVAEKGDIEEILALVWTEEGLHTNSYIFPVDATGAHQNGHVVVISREKVPRAEAKAFARKWFQHEYGTAVELLRDE
jgi:hypothetical protein